MEHCLSFKEKPVFRQIPVLSYSSFTTTLPTTTPTTCTAGWLARLVTCSSLVYCLVKDELLFKVH